MDLIHKTRISDIPFYRNCLQDVLNVNKYDISRYIKQMPKQVATDLDIVRIGAKDLDYIVDYHNNEIWGKGIKDDNFTVKLNERYNRALSEPALKTFMLDIVVEGLRVFCSSTKPKMPAFEVGANYLPKYFLQEASVNLLSHFRNADRVGVKPLFDLAFTMFDGSEVIEFNTGRPVIQILAFEYYVKDSQGKTIFYHYAYQLMGINGCYKKNEMLRFCAALGSDIDYQKLFNMCITLTFFHQLVALYLKEYPEQNVIVRQCTERVKKDVGVHKKSAVAGASKTHTVRIISIKRNGVTTKTGTTHDIQCPVWGVRGHYRTYKNGKKVWIEPYKKGKERNNASCKPKIYKP